jgi:hypothetical protein
MGSHTPDPDREHDEEMAREYYEGRPDWDRADYEPTDEEKAGVERELLWYEYATKTVVNWTEKFKAQIDHLKQLDDDIDASPYGTLASDVCAQLARDPSLPFREWMEKEKVKALDEMAQRQKQLEAEVERRSPPPPPLLVGDNVKRRIRELYDETGKNAKKAMNALKREGLKNARGDDWTEGAVRLQWSRMDINSSS